MVFEDYNYGSAINFVLHAFCICYFIILMITKQYLSVMIFVFFYWTMAYLVSRIKNKTPEHNK